MKDFCVNALRLQETGISVQNFTPHLSIWPAEENIDRKFTFKNKVTKYPKAKRSQNMKCLDDTSNCLNIFPSFTIATENISESTSAGLFGDRSVGINLNSQTSIQI